MKHALDGRNISSILTRTQGLRKLDLTGCELSEKSLAALQMVSNLTSLTLASCTNVPYEHLHYISSLSRLKELDCNELFRSSSRFDAQRYLLRTLEFQRINLETLKLSGATLHFIDNRFSNLTSLDLDDCPLLNESPRPYLSLIELTKLQSLNLSKMRAREMSNEELLQLSIHLTHLRRLGLAEQSRLKSNAFANMSCLQQLEWIDIAGIQGLVNDELIAHLRHCTNLKTLSLSSGSQVESIKRSFVQDVCFIQKE